MVRKIFFACLVVLPASVIVAAQFWPPMWWAFALVGPPLLIGVHDVVQRKHSLLRIYPFIGHGRYLLEELRPEIQQYFVESNTDGTPFSREARSLIYQRAKHVRDTIPFGTQQDVERVGYEFACHSLQPQPIPESEPRVVVGGPDCKKPYLASHLNISAMSFGSLSKNAILALNRGAAGGGFAHNTGEGGISPYHLAGGGDLIWQIGTGYFGCRKRDGGFNEALFAEKSQHPAVKMVEVKLSQGAKPGHGGILPAAKLTEEVATIRGVPMGRDVVSPPSHSAFHGPVGLLEFVAKLRELSGGKPVGFKLCVGYRVEFLAVVRAMLSTGITPDFITVDGTEGGTGAAPVELSNAVGMPAKDGLAFVYDALMGAGLKEHVKIIGAGKVASGFDMFRLMAFGADLCNSARAMMFALGCIQARRCNDNSCPVGVATQDPSRNRGLSVEDKSRRVTSYHRETLHGLLEVVAAAGLSHPAQVRLKHLFRRVDQTRVLSLAEIQPALKRGQLVRGTGLPASWRHDWEHAGELLPPLGPTEEQRDTRQTAIPATETSPVAPERTTRRQRQPRPASTQFS